MFPTRGSALSSRVARGQDVGGDFHRWALLEHVTLLLIFSLSKQRSLHDLQTKKADEVVLLF